MRILLDFAMNEDMETYNNIRLCDVDEIEQVNIVPMWEPNSSNKLPDKLYIELYHSGDSQDDCIMGWYVLDGTEETTRKAIANYNKVVEQLLTKGYAKISDFENTEWR